MDEPQDESAADDELEERMINHAVNAYPKMVECLLQVVEDLDQSGYRVGTRAENLLKELGELREDW